MKRRSLLAASAALAGTSAALSSRGWAQASGPRTSLIVPFAPGGGHDSMARILAGPVGERLGQTVIVDNRPGANGMIGAEYVVNAKPDGTTILFASPAEIVIAPSVYKTVRYDWQRDLVPVTLAGTTPIAIVAHPSVGVRTVPEMIAKAKATAGGLAYGTPGEGSSQHLAGAWLSRLSGANFVHVPYKGAGPATNDVVAGHIPLAIVGMAPVLPFIKSAKLVPVAVTSRARVTWAKDVPTVAETPGLEGFEATHWEGVMLPAKTPDEIVAKVQAAFAGALRQPDVATKILDLGIDPLGNSTAEFRAFLAEDRERFAKMFGFTGLQPQ